VKQEFDFWRPFVVSDDHDVTFRSIIW